MMISVWPATGILFIFCCAVPAAKALGACAIASCRRQRLWPTASALARRRGHSLLLPVILFGDSTVAESNFLT
jgi:hypothetical protein